ncbi:hypothetical protein CERSUDRAFT_101783 [Gelatoporia subvermispora B]|uniref:T6SS Phospholipase effector Tle1-like catalytic domain-containing protein n=1 Tax=Ceriporiopsis subvermispora (strain B) TaxID=914234 RepID=M2RQS7_CERS8|nr:hypothetical protein CERSUDRAFT_101783 [Gelatoporia subvermispora B]
MPPTTAVEVEQDKHVGAHIRRMPREDLLQNRAGTAVHEHGVIHETFERQASKTEALEGCKCGGKRNLVVCIDGTSNQYGKKNTNVVELYRLVKKLPGDDQLTYYNSGIGTYAKPSWRSWQHLKQVADHKIDLAIAWNFERIVLNAYRWLSDNYAEGDCIYLFGFSRGAYQVRTLSAMIETIGLIHKGNEEQIPFAYELYAAEAPDGVRNSPTSTNRIKTLFKSGSTETVAKMNEAKKRFKNTFSRDVKVHFVGAWDTVSSVGVVRQKVLPGTANGMKHVCFFRHALALDERRVKFLPEYVNEGKGAGLSFGGTDVGTSSSQPLHTKEVWFVGTHSDIGGGNIENEAMDRKAAPLRWMVFEAVARGLRLDMLNEGSANMAVPPLEVHESLTCYWWLLELYPFKYLSYEGKSSTRRCPHLGAVRVVKLQEGQRIHGSVFSAIRPKGEQAYNPRARVIYQEDIESTLPLFARFLRLFTASKPSVEKELDKTYESYWKMFKDDEHKDPDLRHLERDLREIIEDAVKKCIQKFEKLRDGQTITPKALVADIEQWTWIRHTHYVSSVSFSPDGARIASGSFDKTVRIWNLNPSTRDAVESMVLTGHDDWIRSVAFSPDSTHVVSGSDDQTIRIWDLETTSAVVDSDPIAGHTIITEHRKITAHAKPVTSVAFSPDGSHIVSGSLDKAIRIWNASTGKAKGEPLRGHSDWVLSVAFSPTGTRVVSGSRDGTVRVWDAETGAALGSTLAGDHNWVWSHTDDVNSVAFSPNGLYIVSGSNDKTVRIWNTETGKSIGDPLIGHQAAVSSVAISPDGKWVVSSSHDKTVRIWDVEDWAGS